MLPSPSLLDAPVCAPQETEIETGLLGALGAASWLQAGTYSTAHYTAPQTTEMETGTVVGVLEALVVIGAASWLPAGSHSTAKSTLLRIHLGHNMTNC